MVLLIRGRFPDGNLLVERNDDIRLNAVKIRNQRKRRRFQAISGFIGQVRDFNPHFDKIPDRSVFSDMSIHSRLPDEVDREFSVMPTRRAGINLIQRNRPHDAVDRFVFGLRQIGRAHV